MYLITNRHLCSEKHYLKVIKEAVDNGVRNIILREKDLDDEKLIKLYEKIVFETKYSRNKYNLIINSNIRLYEKLDFNGIHLPFDMFIDLLKQNYEFNKDKILGLSLHSIEEVQLLNEIVKCKNIKIDYITLSHIYETKCKEKLKPKGILFLKECSKATNISIVALGGILPSNVKDALLYSSDFAVMSTLFICENVKDKIEEYSYQL